MAKLATKKDRAEAIVEAILKVLPVPVGAMTMERMQTAVEEILAEIEKPKTGDCC